LRISCRRALYSALYNMLSTRTLIIMLSTHSQGRSTPDGQETDTPRIMLHGHETNRPTEGASKQKPRTCILDSVLSSRLLEVDVYKSLSSLALPGSRIRCLNPSSRRCKADSDQYFKVNSWPSQESRAIMHRRRLESNALMLEKD
jgi:hypothetical protein